MGRPTPARSAYPSKANPLPAELTLPAAYDLKSKQRNFLFTDKWPSWKCDRRRVPLPNLDVTSAPAFGDASPGPYRRPKSVHFFVEISNRKFLKTSTLRRALKRFLKLYQFISCNALKDVSYKITMSSFAQISPAKLTLKLPGPILSFAPAELRNSA
jgi:hypothetical protein